LNIDEKLPTRPLKL